MKKTAFLLVLLLLTIGGTAQITKRETEAVRITKMGDAYLKDGIFEEAIYHYQKAFAVYPGYVKAQFQLAQSFRLANHVDSAYFHYQAIISNAQDARYPMSRFHLAMLQLEQNEVQAARENLTTFRDLLSANKLYELKRYRDFYEQAEVELGLMKEE